MYRIRFFIALVLIATPLSAQQRQLGVNLSWVNDYANMFIFVDVFKASRPWISHRPSDDTWDTGLAFDVDENGWVRSLQADQQAGTLMLIENGDRYPAGEYLVLYEGEGEIHFDWDAQIVSQEPGRIVINVTPEIGIHMVIRSTNPDNYIRNIRVIMPGFESVYETQPFHPTYVDFLRDFNTLRFMDWGQTVESPPGEWSQRTTRLSATQASIKGVAIEYMIEMANTVGANAWFNVPQTATDDYVANMARLIRDQLRPDLKAYIEYSNEVWNPSFSANAYAREQGLALGLDSDPYLASLRFHSQRSVEIFNIFEREFGSTSRIVRVMGAQVAGEPSGSQWFAQQVLDWQNAFEKTDAYAVAPYFGWFLGTPEFADQLASMSVETVLDSATADMRRILATSEALVPMLNERNVALVTYEAGQGMVGSGSQERVDSVYEKFNAANRHPRMYEIYTEYLNAWAQFGGLMNLYTDIRRYDQWSSYGLLERWDQPIAEAHKYRAVVDFLQTSAQPAPAPFLSFPISSLSFGPVNIGDTSTATFEVGNEGTDTLRVSGFEVDNGMFSVEPTQFNLAPSVRQMVTVRFAPTGAGDQNATLQMMSNDPNVPTATVALSGTGVAVPNITLSETSLDFGGVEVGATNTLVLTVMNTGTGVLTVSSVQSDEAVFVVANGLDNVTIGPGESATVGLQFEPQEGVGYGGTLTVVSDDPNRASVQVSLLGAGFQPRGLLHVSVDTLDFGGVTVGETNTLEITLTNQGAGSLTVQDIQSDESAFVVLGEVQNQVLAPNESRTVAIRFEPQEGVGYGGSLRIVSDDPNEAEMRVVFLGAGFVPAMGRLVVVVDTLNFGSVTQGTQATLALDVANQGDAALQVVGRVDGANYGVDASPFDLGAGEQQAMIVSFVGEAEGDALGTLLVIAGGDTASVVLLAEVISSTMPNIEVRTSELNFGALVVGQTVSAEVVVANTGDGMLQVSSVDSDLSGLSVSEQVFDVAAGAEQVVTVTFDAQAEGLLNGKLMVMNNDGDTPKVTIPVRAAVRLAEPGEVVAGPIALDFDAAEGNQAMVLQSGVTSGDVVTVQVFADGLSEVSGVGFLLMFDPNALTFVADGFTGGDFVPNATYLATDWGGILDVGGVALSGETGVGNGLVGQVRFEVKEGFADSTFLAVTQIGFTGSDGMLQEQRVRVIARLEAGQVVVGDFDGDGQVGFGDFLLFAAAFGGTDPQFDLNEDGVVSFPDFLIFGQAFAASKPTAQVAMSP